MKNILFIGLFITSFNTHAQEELCTPQGAYGIPFGKTILLWKKPVSSTAAVKRFSITPKNPDSRFDEYFVTTNRKNNQVYKIIATKYIEPIPTLKTGDLSAEAQQESLLKANEFVAALLENFDADMKNKTIGFDEKWELDVEKGVRLSITIENYWTVNVECLDLNRESDVIIQFWK
jgi:hypothetical protein